MSVQHAVPGAYVNETATIQHAVPSIDGTPVFLNETGAALPPPPSFDATRMFIMFP